MRRLENRVAIVTGAGSGIGQAIALGYAREGAHIVALGRRGAQLDATIAGVEALGGRGLALPTDVTQPDQVMAGVQQVINIFGHIDCLVNAAGVPYRGATADMSFEDWQTVVGINLTGTFLCCQHIGREMVRAGKGSIINIGSLASVVALPERTAYGASKGGVLQLTRQLAIEWAAHGVRVNALLPGYIVTPMVQGLFDSGRVAPEPLIQRTPMRRLGQPEDLIGPAVFLAADESAYVTGAELAVDGGWLAYGYV